MNVEIAIGLMAKNPAVAFPWEGVVVELVNSFIDEDRRLDSTTMTVEELRAVIEELDPATRQLIYSTELDIPSPTLPEGAVIAPFRFNRHFAIFAGFGVTICSCAILMALKVGDGVQPEHVIELIRMAMQVMESALPAP